MLVRSFLPLSVALALVVAGCSRQAPVQAKQDSGPVPVRAAPVVSRDVQRVVDSVGTLYPYDETLISAEIEGRVDEVKVDLGDLVTQGQVLVHIQEEEQRYLLAQNEALLRQALERLGLKNENDRLKDIREAPDVRRAQADLFDAEQRYKRMRNLVDQAVASQQDLDAAQARFQAMQAAYDSALNQTRNMIQTIEQYKAQLELQRKKLRDATVRAPYAGAIKDRQVNVGLYVRANSPLLTLVRIDPVRLRLEVPERMAPWVKTGQVADVSLEAFEDRKFQGKIWRISPTVDQTKRTFVVEALIGNPNGQLKPGSYARARIPTNKVEKIVLVPARAVNYVFGTNKVYVVNQASAIESREVKLGDRFGDDVEIMEGVHEGEQVATSQINRLETGVQVRVASGT